MKRMSVVLLLVVGCSLAGCRKSVTYTDKEGSKHTVTQSGKGSQFTFEGKQGKVQVSGEGGLSLPEGFPKDVPIYPGSTISVSAAVQEGMHVSLKTADPSAKVAAFYKEKLKAEGWEIESTMNTEESSMVVGKKDKRTVAVVAGSDSDGATVNLTVQTEK